MTQRINTFMLFWFMFMTSCQFYNLKNDQNMYIEDKHSFARPQECVITHLDWKAQVNFDQRKIFATAIFQFEAKKNAHQLILDTKELVIKNVVDQNEKKLNFHLGAKKEFLGQGLYIDIQPETKEVSISYETSPDAEALQWLKPIQTADKKHPFLFTQSQAILARTWIPIQDSPGIRFTYQAEVTVPKNLLALMSASNPIEKNKEGVYHFTMNQPIPAYLMALAVGDVQFHSLGKRSGVYAENFMLGKSSSEFEDLEKMIQAAENLYGPYQWERYDLLVLPSSFPFGGMENPRLTFATPTILAGDKSLTSLVAHELAHSWSGNLVTNATWNDFWLNEGFTVYFENRIMEAMYGHEYAEMLALLSLQELQSEINEMIINGQTQDTQLKLDLTDRNPDDGVTTIAYDKGYYFLRLIEETVGRPLFDEFVKQYFAENAFKAMTTEAFVVILKTKLFEANQIEMPETLIADWIYGTGLPKSCPQPTSNKFTIVDKALDSWAINESQEELSDLYLSDQWSTHEWLYFISHLPIAMTDQQMAALDNAFQFTQTGNSEIFAAWAQHIIVNRHSTGFTKLEEFLVHTGRRKFLIPLYTEMVKTPDGKAMAKRIYDKARPNYHFVASSSIDALLAKDDL